MLQYMTRFISCSIRDHQYIVYHVRYFSVTQVTLLSHTGGDDLKDMVRRMLCRCLTPSTAKCFNWEGRGEKIGLMHYKLPEVVKGIICR